jgi:uncharacterized protein with ParB-like and HNH nuclease domain
MDRNTLEKFFTGKYFVIPAYQRDYAWTEENITDLLSDIAESTETATSHYIGTFILSKVGNDGTFHVVDGQQRLTTLTIILSILVDLLSPEQKLINSNAFIRDISKSRWKLRLAQYNCDYFCALLSGANPTPESKSQRLLCKAYEYVSDFIRALYNADNESVGTYLESLKQLEVMEFIESDEGKAIRIFQTVNDRGKQLAIVEKAKSLLIYYSNRFLGGKHDHMINELFGEIFRDFSRLKEIGEQADTKIGLIADSRFDEDSVLRYHFLSFPNEYYDFKATADYVLDEFLKKTLKKRRGMLNVLSDFIKLYTIDLRLFFHEFLTLVERVQTQPKYYKLFGILGVSTHLYPLLIRLQSKNLLDMPISDGSPFTFVDLVEIADVRIYKTRGTDPAKHISTLACEIDNLPKKAIARKLWEVTHLFMDDALFEFHLNNNMYQNGALLHILIEFGEVLAQEGDRTAYTVQDLKGLMAENPTIEHMFSQTPTFGFPSRKFGSQEEYERLNHRLGNLTVLEKEVNSRCHNKTPEQKLSDQNLYKQSRFDATRIIVADAAVRGGTFDVDDLMQRSQKMAQFCKKRWPLVM